METNGIVQTVEDNLKHAKAGQIGIVGIPFDAHSSYLHGPALAPEMIRSALHSESANMSTESVMDLGRSDTWLDLGDISVDDYLTDIQGGLESILNNNLIPISLGGDHSVTYPIMEAFAKKYDELHILHLDAHGDLYHDFEGDKFSHACPFARIMEKNLAQSLTQIGIRTMTPHQQEQVEKFGVEVIEARDFKPDLELNLKGPLYISLDMDVLDPAYAPGISHYEPGGLSSRDVIGILQGINVPIAGADIVELNPKRDINDMTAMAAAKFLKEIIDAIISNR